MPESAARPDRLRFASFEVDLVAGDLYRDGKRVKLQQKAFQVLAVLLERPGELVSREDLRARLWPADTFVEFDDNLNHAVRKLRLALDDSAESPAYVETVARRGYRFVAPLLAPEPAASGVEATAPPPLATIESPRRRHYAVAALGITLLVLAIWLVATGRRERARRAMTGDRIQSLAVLPLENLSGDPAQEYFADGITEQLTTDLAQIGALRTISRTSAMRYKGTRKPLPQIGRELGVDAVVEGAVVRSGSQVRINAQLVDTRTDRHLWARTYSSEPRDLLQLQMEIARAIASELHVELTPPERARMTGARVVDPVAHELYLKGLHHYYKWQPADFELAIRYFTQATQVDPRFAPAWIGLANSYGFLWIWGKLSLQEGLPKYNEAIRRALEIDEALPEAHYALAAAAFYYRWDWHEAEREFERALELNPNLVEARFEYAYFLAAMGRHLEAIEEAKRAVRTDPLSIPANLALADVYFLARQDERAKAQVLEARDLEPADPKPYRWLASYAEGTGDVGEAVRLSQKAMALSGAPAAEVTAMIQAYERSGAEGYYRWKLRRSSDPVGMAACYLELHDIDSALASLEKAYQAHNWALNGLETKRVWDPLRSDPRFQDLVRRVGLP